VRQSYLFKAHVRAIIVIALLVVPMCLGSRVQAATSALEIEHPIRSSLITRTPYVELNTDNNILEAKVNLDNQYSASGPPYGIPFDTTKLANWRHRLTVNASPGAHLRNTPDILASDFLTLAAAQPASFKVLNTRHHRPTPTPASTPTPPTSTPGAFPVVQAFGNPDVEAGKSSVTLIPPNGTFDSFWAQVYVVDPAGTVSPITVPSGCTNSVQDLNAVHTQNQGVFYCAPGASSYKFTFATAAYEQGMIIAVTGGKVLDNFSVNDANSGSTLNALPVANQRPEQTDHRLLGAGRWRVPVRTSEQYHLQHHQPRYGGELV
jgi:hypothetical protein